jgi:hypothetical protein
MNWDTVTPDEFDAMLAAMPIEIELEPAWEPMNPAVADSIVLTNEVAARLVSGVPLTTVAAELGIKPSAIRKRMQTAEMKDLLAIEARRVVRHLSRRNLQNEKYLGLATAVAVMIDKIRLLNNEPTGITRTITEATIESITIGLHGRIGSEGCAASHRNLPALASEDIPALPEESPEAATR